MASLHLPWRLPGRKGRIYSSVELLPAPWLQQAGNGPVRTFNPTIRACADGYAMAYRVVLPDGERRLASCRLGPDLRVIPDSPRPLSEQLSVPVGPDYGNHARHWFADPRFVEWNDRLLLHWNSGCHDPSNHQFVQELNPITLSPRGRSWELVKAGGQFRIEKNWGLFSQGNELFALYSLGPFRVLRLQRTEAGRMVFEEVSNLGWDDSAYASRFGELRGGAPPVLVDGLHYVFHHSRYQTAAGIRYVAGVLGFTAGDAAEPKVFSQRPLALPNPYGARFVHERLNSSVDQVLYPGGAVHRDGRWLVSYGINDEHCAIAQMNHALLLRSLSLTRRLEQHPQRPWDQAVNPPRKKG